MKEKTMTDNPFYNQISRKTIVTGHYGSGKTEFSVSLAMLLASQQDKSVLPGSATQENGSRVREHQNRPHVLPYTNTAIIDLDIANPYFRSRERRELLENAGIAVYGSAFDVEITAELPALGARLRTPLEDASCQVIIDTGGNDTGALVLNQFTKYFKDDETTVLAVINANRPDTSNIDSAIEHIEAIEKITGLTVSAIVNNTNLLRETTADDILYGNEFCKKICKMTGKSLLCNCYPEELVDPGELAGLNGNLMPMGLYMRPTWLDK